MIFIDGFISNGNDVDDTLVFNDIIWATSDFSVNIDTMVKMLQIDNIVNKLQFALPLD